MIKSHITQLLHDPLALDLIDTVSPMIVQAETDKQFNRRKDLILGMIEKNYTITGSPQQIKLIKAWNEFKKNGHKEDLLEVLHQVEEDLQNKGFTA